MPAASSSPPIASVPPPTLSATAKLADNSNTMTRATLYKLPEAKLSEVLSALSDIIAADPARYALDSGIADELADAAKTFDLTIANQIAAVAALFNANQAKSDARSAAVELFAKYLNVVFNAPTVGDGDIASLGMRPRKTTRTAVVPKRALRLIASALTSGTVELAWDRNGNAYSVNFVVETREPNGEWRLATMTTKAKITLTGFPPGRPAAFRVIARKGSRVASPSNVAVIYASGDSAPLALAS